MNLGAPRTRSYRVRTDYIAQLTGESRLPSRLLLACILEELEDFPDDSALELSAEPLWARTLKNLGFTQCSDDDDDDEIADAGVSYRIERRWRGQKGWYFSLRCIVGFSGDDSEIVALGAHKIEPMLYGQFEVRGPALAECAYGFEFKGSDLARLQSIRKTFDTIAYEISSLLKKQPKLLSDEDGWVFLSDLVPEIARKSQSEGVIESQGKLEEFPDDLPLPEPMEKGEYDFNRLRHAGKIIVQKRGRSERLLYRFDGGYDISGKKQIITFFGDIRPFTASVDFGVKVGKNAAICACSYRTEISYPVEGRLSTADAKGAFAFLVTVTEDLINNHGEDFTGQHVGDLMTYVRHYIIQHLGTLALE